MSESLIDERLSSIESNQRLMFHFLERFLTDKEDLGEELRKARNLLSELEIDLEQNGKLPEIQFFRKMENELQISESRLERILELFIINGKFIEIIKHITKEGHGPVEYRSISKKC